MNNEAQTLLPMQLYAPKPNAKLIHFSLVAQTKRYLGNCNAQMHIVNYFSKDSEIVVFKNPFICLPSAEFSNATVSNELIYGLWYYVRIVCVFVHISVDYIISLFFL